MRGVETKLGDWNEVGNEADGDFERGLRRMAERQG